MKKLTWTLVGVTAALMCSSAVLATELRITHAMSGGSNRVALDQIVANFEAANPDVTVKQIVFDDDIYQDTGQITQLQSSTVPDIFFEWAGYPVERDVEAGYALDLSDAMADGWQDSFIDSVWSDGAGTIVNGGVYMVPTSLDVTNTIWYNVDMFNELGLEKPETWDEFLAVIGTLRDNGVTPIIEGNNELWPLGNWASHIAARVVPQDEWEAAFSREGSFDTPAFHRALELMQELHEAGAFNRDLQGLGADPAMAGFFQGAAAMHAIGSWLVPSATEMAADDFNYDQFDTPVIDPDHASPRSVIGTLTGFMVHERAENPEAAIAFLQFFTTPEQQKIWAEAGSLSPVRGVNEVAVLDSHTEELASMLADADALVPPPDVKFPVPVAEAYYQAAAYVASGARTPDEAMEWLLQTVAQQN